MGELRRLYYQTKEIKSFKRFKWVLKGRWNQGTGNSGNTRTYQQWDELGISYVGSDGVKYGPTYWTVDSFSSSGTPWSSIRGPADLFDGEWGSESSKCDYSGINDTDGYVEIIIHTTSGEAIIPNGVGLISANLQSSFQSSTPGHFILYGLNESTNEYIQLIDVPAASVNKGNTQTTTVTFDPVEVVTGTYYLIAPSDISRGSGLRWEMPPMELWVNDSTEYVAQGGSTRQRNVSFASSIPSTSDMNYITWILDCYLTGGSGGAASINYRVNGGSSGYWNMYAHFNRSLPSFIAFGSASTNWHTDPDATSYIQIIDNVYVNTTLWPKATYKTFKYVFDRTNHRTYFYCEGIYLGYTDILTEDAIKFNYVTLYSDQNRSYEIAKIKNVKVAGFSTLSDARAWNGTI